MQSHIPLQAKPTVIWYVQLQQMQQRYQSRSLFLRNADDDKSHFHVAKDKKDKIQQGFYNELHWLPSAQYCFSSVLEYCETYDYSFRLKSSSF